MSKLTGFLKLVVLPIAICAVLVWGCKEQPTGEDNLAETMAWSGARHVRQSNYQAMPISGGNGAGDSFEASTGDVVEIALTGSAISGSSAAVEKYVTIWATKDFTCVQSAAKGTAALGSSYSVVPKNTTVLLLAKVNFDYLQIAGLVATDTGIVYIWYHEFE